MTLSLCVCSKVLRFSNSVNKYYNFISKQIMDRLLQPDKLDTLTLTLVKLARIGFTGCLPELSHCPARGVT